MHSVTFTLSPLFVFTDSGYGRFHVKLARFGIFLGEISFLVGFDVLVRLMATFRTLSDISEAELPFQ